MIITSFISHKGLGIWLTTSILQFLVIGLPVFVYCFILIVYVALQMKLYVEASCAACILGLFYLLALIVWLTVLGCYHQMKVSLVSFSKYVIRRWQFFGYICAPPLCNWVKFVLFRSTIQELYLTYLRLFLDEKSF